MTTFRAVDVVHQTNDRHNAQNERRPSRRFECRLLTAHGRRPAKAIR